MSSMARETFLHREEKRRRGIAWGSALVLYLLAGLAVFLQGLLGRETFSMNSGPIQIRIGTPEGLDETSRILPALNAASDSTPAPVAPVSPPPPPSPATKAQNTIEAPKAAPPAPAKTQTPAVPEVAMPPTRLAKDPGAPDSGPSGVASGFVGGTGSTSLKGDPAGNASETNFGGGSEAGRPMWVDIYLFMPLPKLIDDAVYRNIPTTNDPIITQEYQRLLFRKYYEKKEDVWIIRQGGVPLPFRPGLWAVLQSAAFDLKTADYRKGGLKPVILDFELGPLNDKKPNEPIPLLSVVVRDSSGKKEIDDAVVYGFRQASFSNSSKKIVRGTFTYRFD